ncbi:Developmental and secondary metabolism regulator veA [Golovinomyces cichoracearum]|uniref:Developmental and secondary metabolism regulator veA n=1 Tax=Golovinomyces cichoracearum TaxID=62708 RepID=A0A420I9Q5_9PEZI|nr:Developmental and secondary metabolism regulator veA [Golovinomyces cichoracearum]
MIKVGGNTAMATSTPTERPSTVSRITRLTKGGRKLTYVLTVTQQPERARACGSGAKSSSDRRPVDPPPVVELKIFNEDGPKPEDITFSYEATFFLFVSLEAARPMSRGRNQVSSPPIPILTGMPVSGMAYLDRPSEAGYFIFSDLSVRHEGHYILNFNLFEECKNDFDQDFTPKAMACESTSPDSSYDWRLEVKSLPFTVYSAKKFPGLTESTHLSRIVAEQGCRVRIRRDVRMRRRDQKFDENLAYDDYIRRQEEESYRERTRSQSLSESSDSSRFSQPEANILAKQSHHAFPRPPSLPAPQRHLPFPDHHHHRRLSGASPPFTRLPPPLVQPQSQTNPFHRSSSPSLYTEKRPHLPPVTLCSPKTARDGDSEIVRSSVAGYGSIHDAPARMNLFHHQPPTYPLNPPPRSPTSISIGKLLSPIKIPANDITGKEMVPRNINTTSLTCESSDKNFYYSDAYHPTCNKRSFSSALPDVNISTNARLFHGNRPCSPLPHIIAEDIPDPDSSDDIMVYKRASGAIRVRRLPIFS